MDPATIANIVPTATGTFNALFEALKAALHLAHDADVNAAIIDIQKKLLDYHSAYLALHEKYLAAVAERDAVKQELLDLKQLEAEFRRYQLKPLALGFSAYALKESAANGEPPHWLCPHCFQKGKKGMLQLSETDTFQARHFGEQNIAHLVCGCCHTQFSMPRDAFNASWGKFA